MMQTSFDVSNSEFQHAPLNIAAESHHRHEKLMLFPYSVPLSTHRPLVLLFISKM